MTPSDYTSTIGPAIRDVAGNAMAGAAVETVTLQADVVGPGVVLLEPLGPVSHDVSLLGIQFDDLILAESFWGPCPRQTRLRRARHGRRAPRCSCPWKRGSAAVRTTS